MSSADFSRNPDNFCYRHPDRQSFVLCQRCLRTICPECQTPGAVGVICPECMGEQRKSATPAQKKAARRSHLQPVAMRDSRPLATYAIIGITGVFFLLQQIPGFGRIVENALLFWAPLLYPNLSGTFEPWRLVTAALLHSGFWHVGLNMLALWMIGRSLEPLLGRSRFLTLYVLSVIGGSVGVALLSFGTPVIGASGGIFGLFGALLVIGRHIGANIRGIAIIIVINFALPFVFALVGAITTGSFAGALDAIRISWQAHLGGFIAGAAVGFIYARTRAVRQRGLQIGLLVGFTIAILALLLVPAFLYR